VEPAISTRRPPARPRQAEGAADTFGHVLTESLLRRMRLRRDQRGPRSWWPALTVAPIRVPIAVRFSQFMVLVTVLVTVPLSLPDPAASGQVTTIIVALTVTAVAWVGWQFGAQRPRLWVASIAVMAAAGGVLAGISPLSTGPAIGVAVTVSAGARLPTEISLALTAETVAAFLIASLVSGSSPLAMVGWSAAFVGMWAFGLTRRAYLLRAEEAEQALEQARRAHQAETQSAALAERARIAREIHDVLAHSLAAVSVNLQAAAGLLAELPEQSQELAKAIECVERASALTREGMTEARRAILALRGDENAGPAVPSRADTGEEAAADGAAQVAGAMATGTGSGTGGEAIPADPGSPAERLPARLRALAAEHGAPGEASVAFTVTGQPRAVGAEAGLTVYRTTQEALTNARKHAPGQPVAVTVAYAAADLTVQVSNSLPPPDSTRPLAQSGAGYGLTGLRERAELIGGTLTAGPDDGQWRVCLRIPA
jgi:signal transduction histidine kinase